MKIKSDFITNSSSVNYTLSDTNHDRKELIVKVGGYKFNLFEEFLGNIEIIKDMKDLKKYGEKCQAYPLYKELLDSGKVIYEMWTDGKGSLIHAYLYHNRIDDLPNGVEEVDIYLGG